MATQQTTYGGAAMPREQTKTTTPSAFANGMLLLGAIMMCIGGLFQGLQGFAAIIEDDFFVIGPEYAYEVDISTWGWIHLAAGIIVVMAGLALLTGALWARILAVVIIGLSAINNFLFIPYQPLWSLTLLVIDGLVLWAIIAHGGELKEEEPLPSVVREG
jgi:hypothetical protein